MENNHFLKDTTSFRGRIKGSKALDKIEDLNTSLRC